MIEVGEYVRTRKGYIDKIIIAENEFDMYAGEKNPQYLDYTSEDIVKHSHNIIDLIEEGDYVNGCKVYENHKTYLIVHQKVKNSEVDYNYINHNEIKSIVTKELFAQREYKVKE